MKYYLNFYFFNIQYIVYSTHISKGKKINIHPEIIYYLLHLSSTKGEKTDPQKLKFTLVILHSY